MIERSGAWRRSPAGRAGLSPLVTACAPAASAGASVPTRLESVRAIRLSSGARSRLLSGSTRPGRGTTAAAPEEGLPLCQEARAADERNHVPEHCEHAVGDRGGDDRRDLAE